MSALENRVIEGERPHIPLETPKPPPASTKKYRTQEEIDRERNEAELFRKARAAEELKEISHLLEPAHQSSVQCLLYVPPCEGREESQVWSGTSDGSIFIWNLKGQQQSTINAHSNQIFSMIYVKANEAVWSSSTDGLRIYLARVFFSFFPLFFFFFHFELLQEEKEEELTIFS